MKCFKFWFIQKRDKELEARHRATCLLLTDALQRINDLECTVKELDNSYESIKVIKNNKTIEEKKLQLIVDDQNSMLNVIMVEREKLNALEEKVDYLQIEIIERHDVKIKVLECVVDYMNNPNGVTNKKF